MKRILCVLLFLFSLATLVGCGAIDKVDTNSSSSSSENSSSATTEVELDPDEIVFIKSYSNFAWGHQEDGCIVTADGRVFDYDFSYEAYPEVEGYVPPTFEEKLAEVVAGGASTGTVDHDLLAECIDLSAQVDPNAEMTRENAACDAGETGIYAVIGGERVLLAASGDNLCELQDDNAKKIVRLLSLNGVMTLPDFGQDFGKGNSGGVSGFFERIFN